MKRGGISSDLKDVTLRLLLHPSAERFSLVKRRFVTLLHLFRRQRELAVTVKSGKYDPPDKARLLADNPHIGSTVELMVAAAKAQFPLKVKIEMINAN
jgi:hypothetical protein